MVLDGARTAAIVGALVIPRALGLASVFAVAALTGTSVVTYGIYYLVNSILAKHSDVAWESHA